MRITMILAAFTVTLAAPVAAQGLINDIPVALTFPEATALTTKAKAYEIEPSCTQLELSAGLRGSACGVLEPAKVVRMLNIAED